MLGWRQCLSLPELNFQLLIPEPQVVSGGVGLICCRSGDASFVAACISGGFLPYKFRKKVYDHYPGYVH